MEAAWVIAAISPIVAASFVYLFKLFETADAMRKQIAECVIWDEKSRPYSVPDIAADPDANVLVGGYYITIERVYLVIGRASFLALSLMIMGVITIFSQDYLKGVSLRGKITGLAMAQTILLGCSAAYLVWVTSIVHLKGKHKGAIDFATARCRNRAVGKASPAPKPPSPVAKSSSRKKPSPTK